MISLIAFATIGLALFLALFLMFRSPRNQGLRMDPLGDARQAVESLESALLPREMVGRVFAREDFDFVNSCVSKDVSRMFLHERRRIALCWVGMVEEQILALRRFHRLAARQNARLNFRTEASLAFDFATLLLACRALRVLLYARGPFAAPQIVGATVSAATRVCEASKQSMAFLTPASIRVIGHGQGGAAA